MIKRNITKNPPYPKPILEFVSEGVHARPFKPDINFKKKVIVFIVQGEDLRIFGCFGSRQKAEKFIEGSKTMRVVELLVS